MVIAWEAAIFAKACQRTPAHASSKNYTIAYAFGGPMSNCINKALIV